MRMAITHNLAAVQSTNMVRRDTEADCLHIDQAPRACARTHHQVARNVCALGVGGSICGMSELWSCGLSEISPNRDAMKHFYKAQDPLVQSFECGEDCAWCYLDELFLEVAALQRHSDDGLS